MQIGTHVVKETYQDQFSLGENAAWNECVRISAGEYPLYGELEMTRRGERIKSTSVVATVHGTVVSDYLGAQLCGVPVSEYDIKQNAGQKRERHYQPYAHSVAESIVTDPNTHYRLFPEFEAREIHFEFQGKKEVTYGIFRKN